MKNHRFAKVAPENQKQGIRWIRLVPFDEIQNGVGLEYYSELSETFLFDDWCENLELALERAKELFGVVAEDWKSADQLIQNGIEIIE